MAKKKESSPQDLQRDMDKLHEFIGQQNFESIEEMQAFMDQLVGKNIDEILPGKSGKPSKQEQSMDLLYEAYEAPTLAKARNLANHAIQLDPDNADAYTFLAETHENIKKALIWYEKALAAGKRQIGDEFDEVKGHFWGYHSTRPYMRAKAQYAQCLYAAEREEEALREYAEMIELNPGDNQGVRYRYAALLLEFDMLQEYEQLNESYGEETGALWTFTYALYLFKKEGQSPKANAALASAHESNPYVLPLMLGLREIPEFMPDSYSWGSEEEAVIYLMEGLSAWMSTEESNPWIYDFYETQRKKN